MKNYFDTQEEKDLKLFNEFNNDVNFFTEISGTPKYTSWDLTATTINGDSTAIELKERGYGAFSAFTYDDVYIEPIKAYNLSKWVENDWKALYVNFFSNGDDVVIWDFKKPLTMKYYPRVKVYNKGRGRYEYVPRFGLSKDECIWYHKFDGDGFKRMN